MRTLKQNFGPSSLLALVSGVLSSVAIVITILFMVATPAAKQMEINGASKEALDGVKAAVRENKDEQAKALSDAVTEIKAYVKQSVDLAQQNREDLRALRESNDRQFIALKDKTDSLWNWMGQLNNKIVTVEAESKIQRAAERQSKQE